MHTQFFFLPDRKLPPWHENCSGMKGMEIILYKIRDAE